MAKYLPENKRWSEITRDERFFCAELYQTFKDDPYGLVALIWDNNKLSKKIGDKPKAGAWELGFEVCYYRDVIHFRSSRLDNTHPESCDSIRKLEITSWDPSYSGSKTFFPMKRTFDLCLFSDEQLIVIEAKVQQGFNSDQLRSFEEDRKLIKALHREEEIDVKIIGLFSDTPNPPSSGVLEYFDGVLTWEMIGKKHQCYGSGDQKKQDNLFKFACNVK
ncbi:MAG: hypothetical protein H6602_01270 [Flavobacteriales bacterium]|nr:hypothetical protein [Flavobacteriales bacterium]